MPSSYTTSLRLTLPATGELAGQWGNTVNTGITELLDSAVAGTASISTWGGAGVAYTLSNNSGTADEARKMFIVATGSPGEAKNVICPAVSKFYVFRNDTTGGFALTLKTSGGTGIAVPAGQYKFLYCDGTNVVEMFNSAGALTLSGALSVGGTATFAANPTLSAGTANQVQYLNASKVLTGSANLTFDGTTLTANTASLTNALAASSGGTGQSTYTAGDLIYATGATALAKLGIGASTTVLTSSGTAPQWTAASSVAIGTATNLAGGAAGSVPYQSGAATTTFLSIGAANTVMTSSGAAPQWSTALTGLTGVSTTTATLSGNLTLSGGTANGVLYLNGSKVATSGSALTFDGTNLGVPAEVYRTSDTSYLRLSGGNGAGTGANVLMFGATHATNPNRLSLNAPNATATSYIDFGVAGAEGMRLTSTGLGIGTSSPTARLHAYSGTAMAQITADGVGGIKTGINFANSGVTYGQIYFDNNAPYDMAVFQQYVTGSLLFGTNNTERMRLDSSGNLGLGVTPSTWTLGKAFQVNSLDGAVVWGYAGAAQFGNNFYYNGGYLYATTAAATRYVQSGGAHQWFTAPSGTAGNAISFTQALTLDANRNLLLNGTTAGASSVGTFTIFNGTAPTGSVTDGVILFAQDISSSSELRVRDEAGNVTTLSPHNFSLIPEGPSEDMAWAYYSEKGGKRINVDMLKLARMVEKLTGEKLVYES